MPPIETKNGHEPVDVNNPSWVSVWDFEQEIIDPQNLASCYCENGFRIHGDVCVTYSDPLPVHAEKMNKMLCNQFIGERKVQIERSGDGLAYVLRWKGQPHFKPVTIESKDRPIRMKGHIIFPVDTMTRSSSKEETAYKISFSKAETAKNEVRFLIIPVDIKEDFITADRVIKAYMSDVVQSLKEEVPYIDSQQFKRIEESGVYELSLTLRDGDPEAPKKRRIISQVMLLIDKSSKAKKAFDCAKSGECDDTWKRNVEYILGEVRFDGVDEVRVGVASYRYEDSTKIDQEPVVVYKNGAVVEGAVKMIFDAVEGGEFSPNGYPWWPGYIGMGIKSAIACFEKDEYDSVSHRNVFVISPRCHGLLGFSADYPHDTFEAVVKHLNSEDIGIKVMSIPLSQQRRSR